VLGAPGTGTPGLSVEAVAGESTADLNAQRIVYRGKDGTPIAVAKCCARQPGQRARDGSGGRQEQGPADRPRDAGDPGSG
jgi:hypothetical protein